MKSMKEFTEIWHGEKMAKKSAPWLEKKLTVKVATAIIPLFSATMKKKRNKSFCYETNMVFLAP